MFDTLYAQEKLAKLEFADQEKFRSIPSLALPAICALDEYLTKNMVVGEWGSGASTLFFAMRCQFVHSIEHSPEWAKKTASAMEYRLHAQQRIEEEPGVITRYVLDAPSHETHWLHCVEPQKGFDPEYASHQPGYESVNFQAYVNEIECWTDGACDVILVDGRARNACLEAAKPKLKPGGLLILDDSYRSIYQRSMAAIEWPCIHFEGCIPFYKHGHTVRTTFWVKE